LKCKCGKYFGQAEHNGKLPNFCKDCGAKLNGNMENYLDIDVGHDSYSDPTCIFVKGRVKGKTVDFRFDTKTLFICEFPEHKVDLAELAFLKTFLTHYAEGRIKIFGKHI
jgi:hypothetical protein